MPSSAATGAGSDGASSTMSRPAGVRSSGISELASRGEDRRRADAEDRGRGERLAAAREPVGPGRAIGEDQDEPGRVVGRRQVAVEERLEVAHRRRQPRRLLDLEDQLAGGRPIGARADDEQRSRVGEARGDRFGAGLVARAGREQRGDVVGIERIARTRCAPTAAAATIGER